jgi:CspA family cold shock protein
MSDTQNGAVKWIDEEKGRGIITGADGTDLFFQLTAAQTLAASLKGGEKVTFVVVDGPKGKQATDVTSVA